MALITVNVSAVRKEIRELQFELAGATRGIQLAGYPDFPSEPATFASEEYIARMANRIDDLKAMLS